MFEQSLREALVRDSGHLGVEHLLLALLRTDSETIAAALRRLGTSADELRELLARELPDPRGAGGR